jgi:hypothetical protein
LLRGLPYIALVLDTREKSVVRWWKGSERDQPQLVDATSRDQTRHVLGLAIANANAPTTSNPKSEPIPSGGRGFQSQLL